MPSVVKRNNGIRVKRGGPASCLFPNPADPIQILQPNAHLAPLWAAPGIEHARIRQLIDHPRRASVADSQATLQQRRRATLVLDAQLGGLAKQGIARALGDIARAKGMTQVAKDAGLSRESLYRALSADGNPSFATVLKVAKALGVKLHAEAA